MVERRLDQSGILLRCCRRLLSSRTLQSHAGLLRPIHSMRQKNQCRDFLASPVASAVTISTTAGLAFATISGIESALKGAFKNTRNARIKARLKYMVICFKDLQCLAYIGSLSADFKFRENTSDLFAYMPPRKLSHGGTGTRT